MRGQPLRQLMLVALVFLAAGVPVWKLTRPAAAGAAVVSGLSAPPETAESAGEKPTALAVEIVFAPAPEDFQLRYLAETILEGRGPQSRFSAPWSVRLPKEGVDLVLEARWPAASGEASAAAARVTIRFPDGRQIEKNLWTARGEPMTELITVPPADAVGK